RDRVREELARRRIRRNEICDERPGARGGKKFNSGRNRHHDTGYAENSVRGSRRKRARNEKREEGIRGKEIDTPLTLGNTEKNKNTEERNNRKKRERLERPDSSGYSARREETSIFYEKRNRKKGPRKKSRHSGSEKI